MQSTGLDAIQILQQDGKLVADYLSHALARFVDAPPRLIESITYSLLNGGKRLRPTLVVECWRASRAGEAKVSQSALAAAGAIELIHTFSLVHDDLPAMDDDDLRRGRPTNHKVFGEAMAILAGDAMVTIAFELLASDADAKLAPALVRELASASGPVGMIGGQVLDMDGQNRALTLDQLKQVHRMKTGALLTAACRLGALAAGADAHQLQAVSDYGRHLGLAFQIVDDLLDVTSSSARLGKAAGKDAAKGKNTYPVLLGIEPSRQQAQQEVAAALEAVGGFKSSERLRVLAEFVIQRDV